MSEGCVDVERNEVRPLACFLDHDLTHECRDLLTIRLGAFRYQSVVNSKPKMPIKGCQKRTQANKSTEANIASRTLRHERHGFIAHRLFIFVRDQVEPTTTAEAGSQILARLDLSHDACLPTLDCRDEGEEVFHVLLGFARRDVVLQSDGEVLATVAEAVEVGLYSDALFLGGLDSWGEVVKTRTKFVEEVPVGVAEDRLKVLVLGERGNDTSFNLFVVTVNEYVSVSSHELPSDLFIADNVLKVRIATRQATRSRPMQEIGRVYSPIVKSLPDSLDVGSIELGLPSVLQEQTVELEGVGDLLRLGLQQRDGFLVTAVCNDALLVSLPRHLLSEAVDDHFPDLLV